MEISQFELIFKPQSPVGPADTVLQGYFLNITNLEGVPLSFRLDFVTSSVSDPDRSLAGNTVAIVDAPDANNQPASLAGAPTAPSFRLSPNVTIPPRGTAKVAVLPSDPFPTPSGPADFEARGYVTLRLPPIFVFGPGSVTIEAQLDRPARVLLTPQNRAVYLDAGGAIADQTQAGVPTAIGAARAEVEPERFVLPDFAGLAPLLSGETAPTVSDLVEGDLAMALAMLSAANLEGVNEAMRGAGLPMALTRAAD